MHNPDHPHYGDTPKAENAIEEADRILAKMASRGAPDVDAERFEQWKQRYAPNDSGEDYDLLAAFRAGVVLDASRHWPDSFKKPNHPTFSVESIYARGADAAKAGRWEGDKFIPPDEHKISQVTIVGLPQPKSWADYRRGALANYGGGHHDGQLEAFRHGMETVFNLIEAEFPPAEQCKSGHVVLLEALRACVEWEADYRARNHLGRNAPHPFKQAEAAIQQAERT